MRDRLAQWFGIKMPSKAFNDSYLLTYGRSDNMTDDEMNGIEADVDRMIDNTDLWEHMSEIQEMIDHPSWYNGDIECIDAMIQTQGVEAVKAFCLCNAFKYLWRHKDKGGDEDIEKAVWYLEKYLEVNHVDQC